jgi:hypothetical protein
MNGKEVKVKEPLQEGEEICDECSGKGFLKVFIDSNQKTELPCSACGGKGKLWWTEKATGVDEVQVFADFGDSSGCSSFSSINTQYSSSGQIACTSTPGIGISNNINSSWKTFSIQAPKIENHRTLIVEEKLCHVSQQLLKIIKFIWLVINTQLLNPLIKGVVRTLKCFKMVLT